MLKIIAEIGSNHNQDFKRCIKLINQAKSSGFTGVKFQLFKAEKLTKDLKLQKEYKKQELNEDWIPKIAEHCKKNYLLFGCSPFYPEAIDVLKEYVDFFKISSFDILRTNLIKECISTKKDVYVSCGLASNKDIEKIIEIITTFGSSNSNYYFLHCVSKYPTKYNEASLKRITELFLILLHYRRKNILVGYSDHTKDIDVIREAISMYVQTIEMHFDLEDEQGSESKHGHCWTPLDVSKLYTKMEKINDMLSNNFETKRSKLLNFRANPTTGLRG
jgi:N-acetylneuraminate synthase